MSTISIVDEISDIGPPTHERRLRAEGGILRAVATPLAGKWSTLPTVRPCAATSQSGTQAISIADDNGAAA
jgi:hypothetical protein